MLINHLNYLRDNTFQPSLRSTIESFFPKIFFSQNVMMENPNPKEENITTDIINLFLICNAVKDIRNLFRIEKETKAIKGRILRDIKNLSKNLLKRRRKLL